MDVLPGELSSGFALEWSRSGLVTGDHEGNISIWKSVEQKPTLLKHKDAIEDTKWYDENVIVSVGGGAGMQLWDLREKTLVKEVRTTHSQKKDVFAVSINPLHRQFILTGG